MIHTFCESCGAVRNFGGLADLQRKLNTGLCRDCWKKVAAKGADNPRWKGGVSYNLGYRSILTPDHPFADKHGYVREHRLVVEKRLGRYLRPDEVIHHINRVSLDNRDGNLLVTTSSNHARKFHRREKKKCYVCGEPQISNSLCRTHVWPYYLKDTRKTNGYNERKRVREAERRAKKRAVLASLL